MKSYYLVKRKIPTTNMVNKIQFKNERRKMMGEGENGPSYQARFTFADCWDRNPTEN